MSQTNNNPTSYHTIEEIQMRKAMLQTDIKKVDHKIHEQWTSLFKKPEAIDSTATPSRRIRSIMSVGAGAFDAFVLGFKLWRRFKK
ncbi:MAG: hypothetical protein ACOYJF_08290 [Prevotella sp.]|jgi:hypothetical protein